MNWDLFSEILFDILTYGIFTYSTLLLLSYIAIGVFSIGETRTYMRRNRFTDYRALASSPHAPSVTILAPAYNEGKNIVENIRSLLSIYYVNLEVIVINDGSKDDSLQRMIQAYDLEKTDIFVDHKIKTKDIRGIYKSRNPVYHKLIVVDKVNGGKADALNVGINVSNNKYLVCIDVDCILEQDALLKMVKPFTEETEERVIATGGVVRIANSCIVEDGKLVKVKLAEDYLPRMQILEYIRAFILGRMAWSRLNGLMLISGAFGAFDKEIAIKCGGYDHNTVGEDMELVVRMRRYMEERKEPYRVTYIPDPLCWTEAPSSFDILGRQRNRWTRGTIETLKFHKKMFFNPKYGILGLLSYPYWFFFEMCAPLIEFLGFICFFLFAAFGLLDWGFFFAYLLFIICFGYLYSAFALFMEVTTYHQYRRKIDILVILLTALTEPFYFHPFVVWSGVKGHIDYLRKKKSWGEMTRTGFNKKTAEALPTPLPAVAEEIQPIIIPDPVPVTIEENDQTEAPSFFRRKLIPTLNKIPGFLFESFRYYSAHLLTLLLLFILARGIEFVLNYLAHGNPTAFTETVFLSLLKDAAFTDQIAIWGYLPFTLFYLFGKRTAHIAFIIIGTLLLLIQVGLSQYFVTTLVPLGADIWSYSWNDIQQTVGAAGGIGLDIIALILVFLFIVSLILIYLPGKLIPNDGIAVFFILLFSTAGIRNVTAITNKMLPGTEFSNNLSINKTYYFLNASIQHFFPREEATDIYEMGYSGSNDIAGIQEKQAINPSEYPFLFATDTSYDPLSPFFNKGNRPPNIVFVIVEGLGRAFSNQNAYLGSFTPFIDSLSGKSLYWENMLSTTGRTFGVLPGLLGSLPFGSNGFAELGSKMPVSTSIINIFRKQGYTTSFYYGGNASFDNMDQFLRLQGINKVNDESSFSGNQYQRLPNSPAGFSWGYDDRSVFQHFLDLESTDTSKSRLGIILTVSTHSPFLINNASLYQQRFEKRMDELGFDDQKKQEHRNYTKQYSSILSADDALRYFIGQYQQRPDFQNTVFIITGDHRMPEIPMSTKIDRYHVPLIIYSPLLKQTARFAAISSHFDIVPSITSWMKKSFSFPVPSLNNWMGTGLDTARSLRNIHAIPLKMTKPDLIDYVRGMYMINGDDLYKISSNLQLDPVNDDAIKASLKAGFDQFKARNNLFGNTTKLLPDSVANQFRKP
jgi:cellulose synthase/poly-beta-1,6-N-acetylglucosamine synthase-like glycosyltransferase